MLHLTNGEATSAALAAAGIEGEIHSVDDILMEGPVRNGLATAQDVLHRAEWLQRRLAIPKAEYLATAARRDRLARLAARHEEVVLWSEEDLFCQVNLANLLTRPIEAPRVWLASPAEGHVATRPPDALRALLAQRRPVTPPLVEAGRAFWRAYASPDPRAIESLAPDPAWPALAQGARHHLRRFPWTSDGLTLLERELLTLLARAPVPFARLFPEANALPALAPYGMGDLQAHAALVAMAQGDAPLAFADDPRALEDARSEAVWAPTPLGREVLEGKRDAVEARGVDLWLGGARLEGPRAAWRWDEGAGRLREGI